MSADRLLYVVGTYPLVTTTFIDREICALRGRGYHVDVLAVRRPAPDARLSSEQRALQAGTTYLLPVQVLSLAASHLTFLLRRPLRYLTTFVRLVCGRHPSLRARAKTVLHFGEAVHAARLARGLPLREIHAHFADRAATIALVVSRLVDVPYSMSVHAGADIFVEPVLLAEKIGRARQVVTCTLHNKRRLASLVGPELDRRVAVVRHGVDTATYREAPSTPRRVPGPPRVLAVGQLTPRKGMVPLLMTCRILRDRGREHRCHIVGDGPQRRELEALARALELGSSAWLRGALAPDEVVAEYRRAAMFVLPCVTAANGDVDGIPNALVEAMASQLPVVSSDLPAIRELVTDGVDGLLVPPGDVEALAAAIERLLDEPALRRELGVRARRTVTATFDIERNIRRLTATLYPELQRQR